MTKRILAILRVKNHRRVPRCCFESGVSRRSRSLGLLVAQHAAVVFPSYFFVGLGQKMITHEVFLREPPCF